MKWITVIVLLLICNLSFADCVILIHGLGRSDASMTSIEAALQKDAYTVINTHYSAKGKSVSMLANEVIPRAITQCPKEQNIHFVTHSLGGILLREYLNQHELPQLKRVVMLGPPNTGSEIVDALNGSFLKKPLQGEAVLQLGTDKSSKPNTLNNIDAQLGIIAGNRSINWVLSSIIPGEDDGKVSVNNTKLDEMDDHIVLPVTHTFMMQNKHVIQQIIAFLDNGYFSR